MIRLASLLALVALPAVADPVCDMRGAEEVPVLEAVKAAFLEGDFPTFLNLSTELMQDKRDALSGPVGQLAALFPKGFDSCQTIVQRRDLGGFVQEVVTFNAPGLDFPMSVYLQAAPIRGKMQMTSFSFNTVLDDVLQDLR